MPYMRSPPLVPLSVAVFCRGAVPLWGVRACARALFSTQPQCPSAPTCTIKIDVGRYDEDDADADEENKEDEEDEEDEEGEEEEEDEEDEDKEEEREGEDEDEAKLRWKVKDRRGLRRCAHDWLDITRPWGASPGVLRSAHWSGAD